MVQSRRMLELKKKVKEDLENRKAEANRERHLASRERNAKDHRYWRMKVYLLDEMIRHGVSTHHLSARFNLTKRAIREIRGDRGYGA